MNKNLEPLLRDRRLRFAATVVPESAGPERESDARAGGGRRPLFNVLRRRLGLIAAVTLAGTFVAGVAALSVPPAYTATAQLIVEPTAAELAAALLGPVIDTHITTLTSDRRLRTVLNERAQAVAQAAEAARQRKPEPPSLDGQLRALLADAVAGVKKVLRPAEEAPASTEAPAPEIGPLRDSLLVRQERLSSILAISVRSRDPEEAAAIVNRLVSLHVEELRERKQRETEFSQAELDAQIASTRAELGRSEDALKAFEAANGPAAPDDSAELIADVQRQLQLARDALREREARAPRTGSEALPEILPEAAEEPASEGQRQRLDDAYEVRALGLRVGRLEMRLRDLQAKSSLAFRQRLEQQALELRIASTRKRLDDLLQRRQDESKEVPRRFAAEARVFALASVPSRPSSVSPFLMLPPAGIAFCVLGIALALVRERMDRSLRSEREAEEALGIPCLGHVPRALSQARLRPVAALRREWEQAEACESAGRALAQICDSGHGLRVVLVAAGREPADAAHLATGLARGLARAGHRVLAIELREGAARVAGTAPELPPARSEGCAEPLAARRPGEPFDRLSPGVNAAEFVLNRADAPFKTLANLYDYAVVEASPVLGTIQTRIVAAKADGVVLGIGWGATRRETACEALQALRRAAPLVGEFDVNAVCVLTGVDPGRYARFQPGRA